MRKIILPLILLVTLNCNELTERADIILYNAQIYTFDWPDPGLDGAPHEKAPYSGERWHPDATAIAISGNRIIAVGENTKILTFQDENTEMVDLKGAFVYPGFADSHTHPFSLGEKLGLVDLTDVQTEAEAVELIVRKMPSVPEGEWIIGEGFDEGAWANRMPDKQLLTEKVPNHPVLMRGLHTFAAWVNQMALDKMNLTTETPDPVGGTIGRYNDGTPNGQFFNNATDLVEDHIPQKTMDQLIEDGIRGLEELARSGYTSTHMAGVNSRQMLALEQMEDEEQLPIRVYGMIRMTDTALAHQWLEKGPESDMTSMYTVRSVKAFYDGSLGVRGARLLEDYSDMPGHTGVSGSNYGFDQLLATQLLGKGFQLSIHAIGDAANREVLDFFEMAFNQFPDSKSNRNRIEHAQVVHPDDFGRFATLQVIASMEPPHMAEDKLWAEARVGSERIKGAYAWRTLRQNGAALTFNSDLPGSDHDLFYGLYAAIARKDREMSPEGGWYIEEKMAPEEAVRAYTSWAAYSGFLEKETGTIQPGKLADISVLDIDVLNLGQHEPDKILSGKVVLVISNGSVIYDITKGQ